MAYEITKLSTVTEVTEVIETYEAKKEAYNRFYELCSAAGPTTYYEIKES